MDEGAVQGDLAEGQCASLHGFPEGHQRPVWLIRVNLQHLSFHLGFDLPRCPLHDDASAVDKGQTVAVLRLVHVVGGHEDGAPFLGQGVQEVPESAPRDGVHAGCGFVQEEHLRLMENGARQGQPLAVSPGQVVRELFLVPSQARHLQDVLAPLAQPPPGDPVGAPVEVQVLPHRQVAVEAEVLGHVADATADPLRLTHDVEAEHRGVSRRGAQEAQQHADGGGLPRPVGSQEAENLPPANAEAHVIHGGEAVEFFGQPFGDDGIAVLVVHGSVTRYWIPNTHYPTSESAK